LAVTDERTQAVEGPLDLPTTHHPTWLAVRAMAAIRQRVRLMEVLNAEVVVHVNDLLRVLAHDPAIGYHLGDEVCAEAHAVASDVLNATRSRAQSLVLTDRVVDRVDRIIHRHEWRDEA